MILIKPPKKDGEKYTEITTFESLVWNEKYQKPGDFTMRTYDIDNPQNRLEIGDIVNIEQSEIPMMVTEVNLSRDSSGFPILIYKGKTLDDVFNYRPAYVNIGSNTFMDAEGPIEFGDKLSETETVSPINTSMIAVNNGGHKFIDKRFDRTHPISIQGRLDINFAYIGATFDPEKFQGGKLNYYEITKDKTVMDVLKEMSSINGFGWYLITRSATYHILVFYQPRVLSMRPNSASFSVYNQDYMTENTTFSGTPSTLNILTRHSDVATSLIPGSNNPFMFKININSIDDKEMSTYEWEKNKRHILVDNPTQEYVDSNSISLETQGFYPFKNKVYGYSKDFYLGDIVSVTTTASEIFQQGTQQMQITEFVRAQDSRGYSEYPVFQPFIRLSGSRHSIAEKYENSIQIYDWN